MTDPAIIEISNVSILEGNPEDGQGGQAWAVRWRSLGSTV